MKRSDVRGVKLLKPLLQLLDRLRRHRDHPNRSLHFDQYTVLLLLYFYSPALTCVRSIVDASKLRDLQRKLSVTPTSLGSFSEASSIFDPDLLRNIFLELAGQVESLTLPRPAGVPADLRLLAADATLWEFLPRMAPQFWRDGPRRGIPPSFIGHLQFDLLRGMPADASVTSGFAGECAELQRNLKAGSLYVADRGYCSFELLQAIVDKGSSFVLRGMDAQIVRPLQERELSDADRQAGVFSDIVAEVGCAAANAKLKQPLRAVRARVILPASHNLNPRRRSGKSDARQPRELELLLLTDRQDLPAETVVKLYHYRWHIEIFFRWLKCLLRCQHFVAQTENGFALQLYTALIASLLITIWTGRKPNKRTLEMIQFYFCGWATLADLEAHLEKLKLAK